MATTDLHGVAFPKLDQRELEVLGRCPGATLRHYRDDEALKGGLNLLEISEGDFHLTVKLQ